MGYLTKTSLAIAVKKGNVSSFPGGLTNAHIYKYYFVLEPSINVTLPKNDKAVRKMTILGGALVVFSFIRSSGNLCY